MDISAISGAAGTSRSSPDRGLGSFESEDFFKILISEMQNQDPFEPTKTADMISQVSQIRSIELSGKLTDTLDLMTRQERVGSSAELIGKYIQAISTAGDGTPTLHEGVVTGVRFDSDGKAVLELDTGEAVPANDVVRITSLDSVEPPPLEENDADVAAGKSAQTQRRREQNVPRFSLEALLQL